jgi:hypothetical protein
LRETAQGFVERLRAEDDTQLQNELKALADMTGFRDQPNTLAGSGLEETLEKITQEHSQEVVEATLKASAAMALSPQWYAHVAVPYLSTNNPLSLRMAAASALSNNAGEWAVDPLLAAVNDLNQIPEPTRNSFAFSLGSALAKTGSKRAVEPIIQAIQKGNNYGTLYGLGYFALTPLTGVPYKETHDAAWWADWWQKNHARFTQ